MTSKREPLVYTDRMEAGRQLAEALRAHVSAGALVLGVPRGGVPVGAEVADALHADLDIIVARKITLPEAPEYALGAVTSDGFVLANEQLDHLEISESRFATARQDAEEEARHRARTLRGDHQAIPVAGREVVVVDDGLATGATVRAAVRAAQDRGAARVIAAVPVGSRDACDRLAQEADLVVCPNVPEEFRAVGMFYEDFTQTTDDEVRQILDGSGKIRQS